MTEEDEAVESAFESSVLFEPDKFTWDASDLHWNDEPVAEKSAGDAIFVDLRDLAWQLAAHRQNEAISHLAKAAHALFDDDAEKVASEIEIAKALVPASLTHGIIQNLFASMAQMLQVTVQQLRSSTSGLRDGNSLIPSLGLGSTGPNLAGWPTL